jgi:hypothetical protein
MRSKACVIVPALTYDIWAGVIKGSITLRNVGTGFRKDGKCCSLFLDFMIIGAFILAERRMFDNL